MDYDIKGIYEKIDALDKKLDAQSGSTDLKAVHDKLDTLIAALSKVETARVASVQAEANAWTEPAKEPAKP